MNIPDPTRPLYDPTAIAAEAAALAARGTGQGDGTPDAIDHHLANMVCNAQTDPILARDLKQQQLHLAQQATAGDSQALHILMRLSLTRFATNMQCEDRKRASEGN